MALFAGFVAAADGFGATAESEELVTEILSQRSSVYLPAIGALGGPAGQPFDNPFGSVSECVRATP